MLKTVLRTVFSYTVTGFFFFTVTATTFAQADYTAPKTEYGQPDLQGVWNFASHTPVQRAERYGNRESLSDQENEENRLQSISAFEARAESHFDGVGGQGGAAVEQ